MKREVLSVRRYKVGYEIRTEKVTHAGTTVVVKSAYVTDSGQYIGDSKWAHRLMTLKGIHPEVRPREGHYPGEDTGMRCCSIGFCKKENKWYGWSHRAIYGFGIGSKVEKGDCAYVPANEQDFIESVLEFWDDNPDKVNIETKEGEEDGIKGIHTSWEYSEKARKKNPNLTGMTVFDPFPKAYGRGEWVAKTLEDAKQMAIDFAESVG